MKLTSGFLVSVGILLIVSTLGNAQNVVTDWNTIASTTIVSRGGKGPGAANAWFAYESIAVYDAVSSIHRTFKPFYYSGRAARDASDEAAAVAAAHRVLVHYFPGQQADLDASYENSIAGIQASASAKQAGIATGEASALTLISERTGDGLEANVPYQPGSGPGVWQPTPPGFLPAATPWLAEMRPFTLTSPSQFRPSGPTPLNSETWVANYNVIRLFGDANSPVRTPAQTEIAIFWTDHGSAQAARIANYLVQNYRLDLIQSSRLLAMLWTGATDAIIGCFDAKYTYNFWRPITAIPAGGGNPELSADPAWTSLATTPNHPEYPSAHGCFTSAVSHLVADFFGTTKTQVIVDSLVFKDGIHTHTFQTTSDWLEEVYWARLLAGLHFIHSLEDGARIGELVSQHVQRTSFRPEHFR